MRFPVQVHPLASPMVPAGPNRLAAPVVGGVTLPAGLPNSTSWLRLSSSYGLLTHAIPRLCVAGTTQTAWRGA